MCLRTERNKKNWFYWCFPTNRAHALDLYLVFMSRTHFKQGVGKVDSPISTSEGSKPVKLRTKTGLAEEGGITIRGATSRILIFRANQDT